ncbi:methyltransferase family protein [Thiomicrorhabdus sediminis]|uniref:Protein-S-isoprenylcysteine O-methyltransferase Ste14 n=1 Tax=Thiomicrorhabdus sediminis TaxID=2580412 RepID=A0A4P9K7T2_9GAMM|nr:methyltransferase [Thiomicrorhabdus sediminis]QCU90520.1 hypothetical protein FE785_07680 [Thiomicrorhabdus sediminis]
MQKSSHNLKHPWFSYALVIAQFTLIALLLLALPLSFAWPVLAIQAVALLLALSAFWAMSLHNFNIIPDPKKGALLVKHGPYRWIRHPMYSSIIIFFLPLVMLDFTGINLILFANLMIVLLIKLHYEEWLLEQVFNNYPDYQLQTKKLFPWIY